MQRWYLFELQELRPFVDFSFHRRQPDVHEELMHSLPCLQSQHSWEEDSFCRSCSLSTSLESSMGWQEHDDVRLQGLSSNSLSDRCLRHVPTCRRRSEEKQRLKQTSIHKYVRESIDYIQLGVHAPVIYLSHI